VDRDPLPAKTEVEQLVGMVQRTLDAIKTFIFDVRPMVLDDLGLVPTLRRVARDRGRRSQVPIEFESYGPDRRLPMDVESALFRLIDETVTGFLSCHPDRISIRFEWATGRTEARISARREEIDEEPEGDESILTDRHGKALERDLPEALKAMIDETRAAKVRRAERITQPLTLPTNTWREVQQRSDTIGVSAELVDDGREVVLVLAAS
jgi:signal transduction histidine kinase